MIFKLQRPLVTNEKRMPCLIYNEDQTIMHMLDMTPELKELFGDEFKVYIESNIEYPTADTFPPALLVGKIVEEQSW